MARTDRELTDERWERLVPLLPPQRPKMGRPPLAEVEPQVLPEVGHFVPVEAPAALAEAVRRCLAG